MRYKIEEPKFFNICFSIITDITNEAFIKLGEKGLSSYGLGPSRIVIYDLQIGENPEEYEIFAFNCQDFQKVLNRIRAAETIELEYDTKSRKVKLIAKYGKDKKTFILNTINPEVEQIPVESLRNLPYSVVLQMKGSEIMNLVNDCKIFSEFITFTIEKDKPIKIGASTVAGRVEIDKVAKVTFMKEDKIEITYGISFLDMIFGNIGSQNCNILFGISEEMGELPLYCEVEISPEHRLMTWIGPRQRTEEL